MKRNEENLSYDAARHWGAKRLTEAGIDNALYDALELLLAVTGMNQTDWLLHKGGSLPLVEMERYRELIAMRSRHIPLQHIFGTAYFYGRAFQVNKDVLIPRQDTEILVEEALKHLSAKNVVLDLCTGSGCIGITLSLETGCRVLATDVSEAALRVAQENAGALGAQNVVFVQSDIWKAVEEEYRFDVIVSNPPYIRTKDIESLSVEVKEYDPRLALDGGKDGLYFYREITANAVHHLNPYGWLLFETGCDQAQAVTKLMCDAGFQDIVVIKDYAQLDRVTAGHI